MCKGTEPEFIQTRQLYHVTVGGGRNLAERSKCAFVPNTYSLFENVNGANAQQVEPRLPTNLMAQRGRTLPVQDGTALIVGRCAIHIAPAEDPTPATLIVHAIEEPRNSEFNGQLPTPASNRFQYDFTRDDPFVAAEMVLRWVNSLEGD